MCQLIDHLKSPQVASLVARVARGCAKLMLRGSRGGGGGGGSGASRGAGDGALLVQAHPDCTVAILMVETTLRNRSGSGGEEGLSLW